MARRAYANIRLVLVMIATVTVLMFGWSTAVIFDVLRKVQPAAPR